MPIIRPNKGYLRKYSPLTPLPLTPLRVPMTDGAREGPQSRELQRFPGLQTWSREGDAGV